MRFITFFLMVVFTVVVGVTFSLLNANPVTVNFYVGETTMPLPLLLLITLGAGVIIGLIFASFIFLRQKAENYRLRHRVRIIEKEVDNLRTLPLKDTH